MSDTLDGAGISYIDIDSALKRMMNNRKLLKRLLGSFIADADANFAKLRDELGAGKTAEAAASAHALKGVCANLSLNPLYEEIKELDALLKRHDQSSAGDLSEEAAFYDNMAPIRDATFERIRNLIEDLD